MRSSSSIRLRWRLTQIACVLLIHLVRADNHLNDAAPRDNNMMNKCSFRHSFTHSLCPKQPYDSSFTKILTFGPRKLKCGILLFNHDTIINDYHYIGISKSILFVKKTAPGTCSWAKLSAHQTSGIRFSGG